MTEFLIANMAPVMFVALIIFLLSGFPVAFSLAANGLLFGLIGIEVGLLKPELLQALPNRLFGIMANDTLLAIPFFTFMGLILERSGMAEDLLDTIGQLFGPMRGGIAYAVIFVGALLAATTGVVAASVISMGLISLPVMLRYGYDRKIASGVIAASGTLAQIIPPSIVLIVMADQLGRSVGDMYQAAFLPGLVLTAMYAGYIMVMSLIRPAALPALPPEARNLREADGSSGIPSLLVLLALGVGASWAFGKFHLAATTKLAADEIAVYSGVVGVVLTYTIALANSKLKLGLLSKMAEKVILVLVPPLALIFLVLGTIFVGIATPTEGGGMGALGAMILAFGNRRLTGDLLKQAMNSTSRLACFVLFILIGSSVFSLVFRGINGDLWVEHLLTSLPGGNMGFLIVVNLLFFGLAFFLDFFELAFILVPLVGPVADKMGIDLIWFGVLLSVNMQTSFMHPPFGLALFFLRSVAPKEVKTSEIYWGAVPFVGIQLLMVAMIIAFPSLISVGTKTDMTEQIELNVQIPSGDMGSGAGGDNEMQIDFNLDGDKQGSTEIKLDMGDPDKK